MRTFLQAVAWEFRAIFSDSGLLLVFVGAVFFYALVYPIPYLPQVLKEVPVVVVDLDHSALSRQLVRMVDATEQVQVAGAPASLAEAEVEVREGRVSGALVIPENFQEQVKRGRAASVAAYADASYFLVYRQAMTGMVTAARVLSAGIEIQRLRATGVPAEQALKARDPVPLVLRPLFNPSEGYASFVVPAVFVLILHQTLLIGIGMLGGTMRERGASPSPSSIGSPLDFLPVLLGRTTAYLLLYGFHSIYYFGVVYHFYGFPHRGTPGASALFLLPFLLSVIFLGITLSGLFRDRETAMQALLFTSIPALFLVGFSWPPEVIPAWLRSAALLIPSTAGIGGFLRVNQLGASLHEVRFEWLVLWSLAALYFLTAWISTCTQARRTEQEK